MPLNPKILARLLPQQPKSEPMRLTYISGPMTGLPDYNRPAFNKAAEYLRKQGHVVWNPAEEFDSEYILPRKIYMRRDIEALLKCESIVMLKGWENSSGARLELEIARELEMNIFFLGDNSLERSHNNETNP
jgi:hypothetical protein